MIMLFLVLVAQRIRVKTPRKYHIDIILHAFFFFFIPQAVSYYRYIEIDWKEKKQGYF